MFFPPWGHCVAYSRDVWNKGNVLPVQKGCCSHESAQSSSLEFSASSPYSERVGSGWQTAAGFLSLWLMGTWNPYHDVPKGNSNYKQTAKDLNHAVLVHLTGLISSGTTEYPLQILLPLVLLT